MHRLAVVVSLVIWAGVAVPRAGAQANEPVKVYILSGQSNMVGFAKVSGATTPGTLENLTNQGMYPFMGTAGNWTVRNDVYYEGVISANRANGFLTVGGGADTDKFGPELGFGHAIGNFHAEPVLLIKTSIGNRSLGWDYLPPGSAQFQYTDGQGTDWTYAGYGDSPNRWETGTTPVPINWYAGKQYDDGLAAAKDVLDNFDTKFPNWADRGFEIAGFVWWQGHKDQSEPYASRYEQNMVRYIDRWRNEFNAPEAPFALATIGFDGWNLSGAGLTVANGQLAVSGDAGNYPQHVGNVQTVETRDYWRDASVSPSTQDYHYNWNAETYMNVGTDLGDAMAAMYVYRSYLEVDRQTGEIRIVNPSYGGADLDLAGYAITSASGALVGANWLAVADHYDADSGGAVDADDTWSVANAATGELREAVDAGGVGGQVLINNSVSLGVGAWLQHPDEDLQFTYTDAGGAEHALAVRYTGAPIVAADYDFDGLVEADDWAIFIAGAQADMSSLTAAQSYRMGDLDGDGDNDIYDFDLFRLAFEADNPQPQAFEQMLAEFYGVPEPASLLLLAAGAAGLASRRSRSRRSAERGGSRRARRAGPPDGGRWRCIALIAPFVVSVSAAHGLTLNMSASAPTENALDVANLLTPTGGQLIWTDRDVQGQTFTTGNEWGTLNSITVQIGGGQNGAIVGWKDYRFRFGIVTAGTPYSISPLVDQTVRQGPDVATDSFFTFALDAPITLSPNTLYGFDVGVSGSQEGWQQGIPQVRTSGNDLAGGQRYDAGRPNDPGTALSLHGDDTIFHADIDTVPGSGYLTLHVNTTSGAMALRGSSVVDADINYYQVTSAGNSLDATGWRSLEDQDFEGNGPPTGFGNGWEEAGAAGPHALAEGYLLGDSTIGVDALIAMGAAYDESVDARDLALTYRTATGQIFDGNIEYFSPLAGDIDGDGDVDNADLGAVAGSFTGSGGSTSMTWADGDMDGDGDVDNADLGVVAGAFTGSLSSGELNALAAATSLDTAALGAMGLVAVPEPASGALVALGGWWLVRRRGSGG